MEVKKIGRDANTDLDIYAYRYKGDPKTYPKVVGPMAQDVAKKSPGAAARIGGKLAVTPGSAAPARTGGDAAPRAPLAPPPNGRARDRIRSEPHAPPPPAKGRARPGLDPGSRSEATRMGVDTPRDSARAPEKNDARRTELVISQLSELVRSDAPMPQGVKNAFTAWSKYADMAARNPRSPRAAAMLKLTSRNLANNLQAMGLNVAATDLMREGVPAE